MPGTVNACLRSGNYFAPPFAFLTEVDVHLDVHKSLKQSR